jgi:hypothetical protein
LSHQFWIHLGHLLSIAFLSKIVYANCNSKQEYNDLQINFKKILWSGKGEERWD